jgi:hypothetical protein
VVEGRECGRGDDVVGDVADGDGVVVGVVGDAGQRGVDSDGDVTVAGEAEAGGDNELRLLGPLHRLVAPTPVPAPHGLEPGTFRTCVRTYEHPLLLLLLLLRLDEAATDDAPSDVRGPLAH